MIVYQKSENQVDILIQRDECESSQLTYRNFIKDKNAFSEKIVKRIGEVLEVCNYTKSEERTRIESCLFFGKGGDIAIRLSTVGQLEIDPGAVSKAAGIYCTDTVGLESVEDAFSGSFSPNAEVPGETDACDDEEDDDDDKDFWDEDNDSPAIESLIDRLYSSVLARVFQEMCDMYRSGSEIHKHNEVYQHSGHVAVKTREAAPVKSFPMNPPAADNVFLFGFHSLMEASAFAATCTDCEGMRSYLEKSHGRFYLCIINNKTNVNNDVLLKMFENIATEFNASVKTYNQTPCLPQSETIIREKALEKLSEMAKCADLADCGAKRGQPTR